MILRGRGEKPDHPPRALRHQKRPCPRTFVQGQEPENSCGATLLDRSLCPLCAYFHMLNLANGASPSVSPACPAPIPDPRPSLIRQSRIRRMPAARPPKSIQPVRPYRAPTCRGSLKRPSSVLLALPQRFFWFYLYHRQNHLSILFFFINFPTFYRKIMVLSAFPA